MPTPDADRAFADFLNATGQTGTPELRTTFDAGFTARGELDTKAIRLLRKGGWVLPDRLDGFNLGIAAAVRHIGFVGGAPRRAIH